MSLRGPLGPPPAGAESAGPTSVAPGSDARRSSEPGTRRAAPGLVRSIRLFRLFLLEQTEPEGFSAGVGADSGGQVARDSELAGRTVIDVGGGAGYFTAAFRGRGANCYLFEPDQAELLSGGEPPAGAVQADGYWLPAADGSADICFSSNVLEHVADPVGLIDEMIRVTRPDGVIYLSFTNWYSPWGGHEMSPWHLLGANFPAPPFVRRHGPHPKHHLRTNFYLLPL